MYSVDNLIGENAYVLLGYVKVAMEECKKSREEITAFLNDAKSSNYEYLCDTCVEMCQMLNSELDNSNLLEYNGDDAIRDAEASDYGEDSEEFQDILANGRRSKYYRHCNEDFPAYEDVMIDDDFRSAKKLENMNPGEKCLYMDADDLQTEEITVDDIKKAFNNVSKLTGVECNGAIQIIFDNNSAMEFNTVFVKKLTKLTGLTINDLKPYIFNAAEMVDIIRDSFNAAFAK